LDLQLYGRILWRFRILVACGLLIALSLSFLSYMRVGFAGGKPTLAFRQNQRWEAHTMIFLTQPGFPWGRAVQRYAPAKPSEGLPPVPIADLQRLSGLAILYSQLANSDQVKEIMRRGGPVPGFVQAAPFVPASVPLGTTLPLVKITALASSGERAMSLANRRTDAFRQFIEREQGYGGIASEDRIDIAVLQHAQRAKLIAGRKKTLPMVVFLAVMIAVVGLAFMLENLRPRSRPLEDVATTQAPGPARRSA
jgi:hypothetical protein